MKKKTIQQEVFREIRNRDGLTYAQIAERCGISEDGISRRMRGSVELINFVQMVKACGYDIEIVKAPETREAGVFFGVAGCDGCPYKNLVHDMYDLAGQTIASDKGATMLGDSGTASDNTEENE